MHLPGSRPLRAEGSVGGTVRSAFRIRRESQRGCRGRAAGSAPLRVSGRGGGYLCGLGLAGRRANVGIVLKIHSVSLQSVCVSSFRTLNSVLCCIAFTF